MEKKVSIDNIRTAMERAGICDWAVLDISGRRQLYPLPDFSPRFAVMAIFPYYGGEGAKVSGNISLYARGRDYHAVLKERLSIACSHLGAIYGDENFLPFCDNSPLCEVSCAAVAGLGKIGAHNLLITPRYGSWCFIGALLSPLPLEEGGSIMPPAAISCSGCLKCAAACPTGAIEAGDCGGVRFNPSRCLSHITQRKGELSPWEHDALKRGGTIWGCDACQRACPLNDGGEPSYIGDFRENIISSLALNDVEGLSNRAFLKKYRGRAFTWRGVGPMLRNLRILEEE